MLVTLSAALTSVAPCNTTIDVSFDTLTSPFLVPLTEDLIDFGDDFADRASAASSVV